MKRFPLSLKGLNLHAEKHWKAKPCPAFCREHVSQPHHNQYARKHPKVNPTWIARLEWNSGASPWQCPIVSRLTRKNSRPNWMDFMIGDLPVYNTFIYIYIFIYIIFTINSGDIWKTQSGLFKDATFDQQPPVSMPPREWPRRKIWPLKYGWHSFGAAEWNVPMTQAASIHLGKKTSFHSQNHFAVKI